MIFVVNIEMHTDEDMSEASLVLDAYGSGKTAEEAYQQAVSHIGTALSKSDSEQT